MNAAACQGVQLPQDDIHIKRLENRVQIQMPLQVDFIQDQPVVLGKPAHQGGFAHLPGPPDHQRLSAAFPVPDI